MFYEPTQFLIWRWISSWDSKILNKNIKKLIRKNSKDVEAEVVSQSYRMKEFNLCKLWFYEIFLVFFLGDEINVETKEIFKFYNEIFITISDEKIVVLQSLQDIYKFFFLWVSKEKRL